MFPGQSILLETSFPSAQSAAHGNRRLVLLVVVMSFNDENRCLVRNILNQRNQQTEHFPIKWQFRSFGDIIQIVIWIFREDTCNVSFALGLKRTGVF